MQEKLERLKELLALVADLNHAIALLDWDQPGYPGTSRANSGWEFQRSTGLAARECPPSW